jgi:HK97 family phage major capsid protein
MKMRREQKEAIWKHITSKAIAGQGETVDADGGALIDQPVVSVLSPNFMLGTIYSETTIMNIDKNNGIKLPRYDTTNINTSGFWGVDAAWVSEGDTIPVSKIKFDQQNCTLNKLAVMIPATEEIVEDVELLPSYIDRVGGEALRYEIDRSLIYGASATEMAGVVAGGKESTIFDSTTGTYEDIMQSMVGSYYGGKEGAWYVPQSVYATIVTEYDADFGLTFNCDGDPCVLGYPLKVVPSMAANNVLLADFSQYLVVQKELRRDISEHLYFSTQQNAVRLVARMQGAPIWSSSTTLPDGSVVSPFVATANMEV